MKNRSVIEELSRQCGEILREQDEEELSEEQIDQEYAQELLDQLEYYQSELNDLMGNIREDSNLIGKGYPNWVGTRYEPSQFPRNPGSNLFALWDNLSSVMGQLEQSIEYVRKFV